MESNYVLCPKCKHRHLPVAATLSSGRYQSDCLNCGHVFQFKYASQPKDSITITVNGTVHQVPNTLDAGTSLNAYLRDELHLRGTKKMCYEGGCGVCVVVATYTDPVTQKSRTASINSCLCLLYSCDGWQIITIEGLGNHKTGFHVIQQRLADYNGSQCGYCSPGMVMNMYGFLQSHPNATKKEIEDAFDGNICRCTGYRPILDAMKSFSHDSVKTTNSGPVDIEEINKLPCNKGKDCCGQCPSRNQAPSGGQPQEPIRLSLKQGISWFQPTKLNDVYPLLKAHLSSGYKLIAGNTSIGVYEGDPWTAPAMIDIRRVPELLAVTSSTGSIMFGACVTLTDFFEQLRSLTGTAGYGYLQQAVTTLDRVANQPVRDLASWAGNLMIKHKHQEFPSDIFCFLAAIAADLVIGDVNGTLNTVQPADFLKTDMTGKILTGCRIHKYADWTYVRTYKVMARSRNAHAIVNAGICMVLNKTANVEVINQPAIYLGGISTSFVRASKTETYLVGKSLASNATLQGALSVLKSEVKPDSSGGLSSTGYRLNLALSLLYKFFLDVCGDTVAAQYKSGAVDIQRPLSAGQQVFDSNPSEYPVTKPIPKLASKLQTAGEAEFVSDMIPKHNEVYAKFVLSTVANAEIDTIDASKALSMPGVLAFITAKDIPGANDFNYKVAPTPEELLCSGKVLYAGQPIGILVTETEGLGYAAMYAVSITYKNVQPPVLTMDEAIAADSFFNIDPKETLTVGDAAGAISKSSKTISGKVGVGNQYHLAMETQACRAIPTDDGLLLHPTTQWMDAVQRVVANMLNMKNNAIQLVQRRIGGSFGSLITRYQTTVACALAAYHTNRPVYMKLDMKTNMIAVGGRHPVMADYQVGFTDEGRLNGIEMTAYEDAGSSPNDFIVGIMKYWIDNAYHCDNWKVIPKICKTDLASRTNARAPGSFQAIFVMENIIEHVAKSLNKDPATIKKLNLCKDGQVTPMGNVLKNCNIDTVVNQLETSSDYVKRQQDLQAFNKTNRWKKKSLAMSPVKWVAMREGLRYPVFVTIYNGDGSVAVSHGGVESGQGCDVKVAQIVAYELGIPLNMVKITANDSIMNSNSSNTGGSVTSEVTGYGAIQCCTKLKERMKPVKDTLPPGSTWLELVEKCFTQRIDLTERCYNYNDADMATYFCYGACAAEVELDVLTGENQINRVDMLMDVGTSLNPEIDIGQTEGGFMMGVGCLMTEEILYEKSTGRCLTPGTWEYKPPMALDIPVEFRVSLLKNTPNPLGVLGSKAIAEPAICVSPVVMLAAKHAVEAARADTGRDVYFPLHGPATVERLQLACVTDSSNFLLN